MMSASSMSAMIRAKKKKMEDEREVVKLSGIPMDATDIAINENKIEGEKLSENAPKEHSEDPDDEMEKKHAKIKAMMMRMGM